MDVSPIFRVNLVRRNVDATIRLLDKFRSLPEQCDALLDDMYEHDRHIKRVYRGLRQLMLLRDTAFDPTISASFSDDFTSELTDTFLHRHRRRRRGGAEDLGEHRRQLLLSQERPHRHHPHAGGHRDGGSSEEESLWGTHQQRNHTELPPPQLSSREGEEEEEEEEEVVVVVVVVVGRRGLLCSLLLEVPRVCPPSRLRVVEAASTVSCIA